MINTESNGTFYKCLNTIHNFWQAARIVDNNSRDQKLAVLMKCYKDGNDSEKTRFSY